MLYALMRTTIKRLLSVLAPALVLLGSVNGGMSDAAPMRVAVASNFLTTARDLAVLYKEHSGEDIVLINGSSGTLFAQISHGAPYDLFLSADLERPQALSDVGISSTPVAYAKGTLVLISRDQDQGTDISAEALAEVLTNNRTAIADPDLAPYGAVAMKLFETLDIPADARRLIYGANVSAAAGLFASGNVDQALISKSLAQDFVAKFGDEDAITVFSLNSYNGNFNAGVLQFGAILSQDPRAEAFLELILSEDAAPLMSAHGYQQSHEVGQ